MDLKKKIYNTCLLNLQDKLNGLGEELRKMSDSSSGETKSSMGDKYETSREMMQQERNKIGSQIEIVNQELALLKQLNISGKHEVVMLGSLIETKEAYFFISVPMGQLSIKGQSVFVLSASAPLAKLMIDKRVGDRFEFNRQIHEIVSIQ